MAMGKVIRRGGWRAACALAVMLAAWGAARPVAADEVTPVSAVAAGRGSVTNLPLPRYVSLKTDEGNVRRGPSLSHRVDWVFRLRDMPLRVTAEHGHWRRVVDRDGAGGWVHFSLLSGVRTVLVEEDLAALRTRPLPDAPEVARLEAGVVARLGTCGPDWCRVSAGGYRGWMPKSDLWGVDPDEVRD
jgi:SH3-like domain-containing protein